MMDFGDLIGNVMTGGATGLLGALGSAALGIWRNHQNHKQELAMRALDIKELELEAAQAERQNAHETEMADKKYASEGLQASYREATRPLYEGDSTLLRIADFIRTLVRPVTLATLSGFVIAIYFTTADESIRDDLVSTVRYLFSAVIVWYFGGRQLEKG